MAQGADEKLYPGARFVASVFQRVVLRTKPTCPPCHPDFCGTNRVQLSRAVSSGVSSYEDYYVELNRVRSRKVAQVREVTDTSKDDATALLIACRWDCEALTEHFFEAGFRARLGVTLGEASLPAGAAPESRQAACAPRSARSWCEAQHVKGVWRGQ